MGAAAAAAGAVALSVLARGGTPAAAPGPEFDVAVVGLGPNGLRTMACLHRELRVVGFERGRVGNTARQWHSSSVTQSALDDDFGLLVGGVGMDSYCTAPSQGRGDEEAHSSCTRDQYVRYLDDVVATLQLLVLEREEVFSIRWDEGDARFQVLSRGSAPRAGGQGGGAADARRTRARFVVLALGSASSPRPLSVPGAARAVGPAQLEPRQLIGRDVAVIGSGNTAHEIAIDLCQSGARRVVLFSRTGELARVAGQLSAARTPGAQRAVHSPPPALDDEEFEEAVDDAISGESFDGWLQERYGIREAAWIDELSWYRGYIAWTFSELQECGARGVLVGCPGCEVVSMGDSDVRFQRAGEPEVEAVVVDDVVVAIGGVTDVRLLESMGFPPGEVDERTGETTLRDVFVVGLDPPGAPQWHSGGSTYHNWLAWGGAAAQGTCREVLARARRARAEL